MYCRKCGYVLDGLREQRCPECGRDCDPADRRTYRTKPKGWWRRWVMRQAKRAAAVLILLLLIGGGWVGWRYHSEQRVIERVKQLSGTHGLKPAGPRWLTDWVRRRGWPSLSLVTSVSFISGSPPQMTASIDQLIAALDDPSSTVRLYVALALGRNGDPSVVEPLIRALRESSGGVRSNVAHALQYTGDPRALDPLLSALDDQDPHVRASVAWVLRHFDEPRVATRLIEALQDQEAQVVAAAADSLGHLKADQAIEPLIAALGNEDLKVRDRTARSLHRISGKDFGLNADEWRSWYEARPQPQSP